MIKVGIIGFGSIGHYHYNTITKEFADVEVKGIYDIDLNKQEEAKNIGLYAYKTKEELLCDKDIQLIIISCPNDLHFEYTILAAKHKKHILCEKPVALNSQELLEMERVCKEEDVIFTVHQNRRWDLDYLIVKDIYQKNTIGDIFDIEMNIIGSHGIPGQWRRYKEYGGGMLYDWGVHKIDQMLQLVDSKVVRVYAELLYYWHDEVDDGMKLTIEFANGFKCHININTKCLLDIPMWRVYGDNGSAEIINWNMEGSIKKIVNNTLPEQGIVCASGVSKTIAKREEQTFVVEELPKLTTDYLALYKNLFTNIIENKRDLYVKIPEVLRCLKVIELAFLSNEKKQVIETNL